MRMTSETAATLRPYIGTGEVNIIKVYGMLEGLGLPVPPKFGHLAPMLEDHGFTVRRDYTQIRTRWYVSA